MISLPILHTKKDTIFRDLTFESKISLKVSLQNIFLIIASGEEYQKEVHNSHENC